MKWNLVFISFYLLLSGYPDRENIISTTSLTADEILQKTADRLNSCTTLQYLHQRDYFNGDTHFFLEGHSFIDFHPGDSVFGLKYQVRSNEHLHFFNGTESFTLDDTKKTLTINTKPEIATVDGNAYFYNSLVSLRRILPLLAGDKSISKTVTDTLVNGKSYHCIHFTLHKKTLGNFGGLSPVAEARTFYFTLLIDKNDHWPHCLLQSNNTDEHNSRTTFTQIKPDINSPDEKSWYYSTYLDKYRISTEEKIVPLPTGMEAPLFELPFFSNPGTTSSQQYKNKALLLEFWIRNCGPCIESVPKLNALQENFRSKGLEILAVNAYDAKPAIHYFVSKYKPAYPIAWQGEKLSKQFGVTAYPVVFLINKKGIIIYSGGFDENAILKALKNAL